METISTSASGQSEASQLQELAQRLSAWRTGRSRGQRIPEELWKAAAELAQLHGLSRTATALKLSYYDLQHRLPNPRHQTHSQPVMETGPRMRRQGRAPAFVELVAPAPVLNSSEPGTVEIVQASGTRLTLRLPKASAQTLLSLVHLFLRA